MVYQKKNWSPLSQNIEIEEIMFLFKIWINGFINNFVDKNKHLLLESKEKIDRKNVSSLLRAICGKPNGK